MSVSSAPSAPPGARPSGRPPRIHRRDVAAAAIAIAEEQGLEQLSLRSVADRLAVTPAALYRLVDSSPALVQIVVEAVVDEALADLVLDKDWRKALEDYAHVVRKALLRHPLLVEAYQQRVVTSTRAHAALDQILLAMQQAGMSVDEVIDSFATVHAFVVGYAAFEHRRAVLDSEAFTGRTDSDGAVASIRERFAHRYYSAEGFEVGLATVLDGVTARMRVRPARGRGRLRTGGTR